MNKTFQTITTILIIVLLFLLMWVFISYYTSPVEIKETNKNINSNVPSPNVQVPVNNSSIISDVSSDLLVDNETTTPPSQTVTEIIKDTNMEGSVIISSDPNISNSEKQQVLNEIDEALSELLVVVDSVTTVDETRLGIEEEVEVQP